MQIMMTVSGTRDALELLFEVGDASELCFKVPVILIHTNNAQEETLILQMVAQLESRILQEIDERDLFRSQLRTYQDPELVKLYTRSDDKLSILALEVLKFTGSHRVINKRIQDCLMAKRPMIKESYGAESVVSKWRLFSAAKPHTKKLRFPPPVPHKTHSRGVQDDSFSESHSVSLEPIDTGKPFLLTVGQSSETLVTHHSPGRFPNQTESLSGAASAFYVHEDDKHTEVVDQRMIQELKEYSKWKLKAHLLSKHATDSRHVFDMLEVAINEDLKSLLREKRVLRDKLAEQNVVLTDVSNQRNLLHNILVKERDPRIGELEHQLEIFAREKVNLQEKNNLLEGNIRFYEFKCQELQQYTENMEMQIKSSSKSGKMDVSVLKHKSELEVKIKTMDKQVGDAV